MINRSFVSALALAMILSGGGDAGAQDKKADNVPAPFGLPGNPDAVKAPAKLEPVFNGKDLSGFKVPSPNPWWTVVNGVLVGQNDPAKKGNVLYTEKSYGDFALETEVRFPDNIDSGVMYGKPELQVQFGVSRSLKTDMTGSIYYKGKYPGRAQGVDKLLTLGDWNAVRIEKRGKVTKVWLNGQHVLTWECPDEVGPAPIGVQIHPGVDMKVEFRSLRVGAL